MSGISRKEGYTNTMFYLLLKGASTISNLGYSFEKGGIVFSLHRGVRPSLSMKPGGLVWGLT